MSNGTLNDEELIQCVARMRRRIGQRTRSIVHHVEKGAIENFVRAIGVENPLYLDEKYAKSSRYGGLIAPPTYCSRFLTGLIPDEVFNYDEIPLARNLLSGCGVTSVRPIRAGDVITASAEYVDCYMRQGHGGPLIFQRADLTLIDASQMTVAVVSITAVSL